MIAHEKLELHETWLIRDLSPGFVSQFVFTERDFLKFFENYFQAEPRADPIKNRLIPNPFNSLNGNFSRLVKVPTFYDAI